MARNRGPTGWVSAVGLLACAALWLSPVAPAAAAKTAAGQAARLAREVEHAHGQAAGARALLAVAKALGWPVVTARGKVLYSGARNVPRGFLVYDFELAGAAHGVLDGAKVSLDSVASSLTTGSVRQGNKPITATGLQAALAKAVGRAVRKPGAPGSLAGLLLRDLGRDHSTGSYDLASKSLSASEISLDPAQQMIFIGELVIASHLHHGAAATDFGGPAFARAEASTGGPFVAHAASGPCHGLDDLKTAIGTGKLGISAIGGLLSNGVKIVTVSIDYFHGTLMAEVIEASATTSQSQSTHYGPAGHESDAGKSLRLTVRVFNDASPSDVAVDCGPLAGMKFPPHGPVKGIPVNWDGINDIGLYGSLNLGTYGTVSYDPADQATGTDGTASLLFTPNNEQIPGFGTVRTGRDTGASANVHVQSGLGNLIGAIANAFVPVRVDFQVTVTAHVPRGFKFGPAQLDFTQNTKDGAHTPYNFSVKGQLCGADPWADPFTIDETASGPFGSFPARYDVTVPQLGNVTTGSDFMHSWSLPAPAGPYPDNPFRLRLTITPNQSSFNGNVTPSSLTVNPDVTEDTTCPLDQNWRLF